MVDKKTGILLNDNLQYKDPCTCYATSQAITGRTMNRPSTGLALMQTLPLMKFYVN